MPYVVREREWLPSTGDQGQPVGRLRMYTTDAFAFYLLSLLTSPDLTPRKAGEVVIDRLAFDDVSPQLVIVAGCHPDWSRIVATSRGVQESVQEEQAAEPGGAIGGDDGDGRPPAVEEGNADGNAANVFDFMSFLSDPNEASAAAFGSSPPPRAKRRKTENGRGPAGNSTDTNNPDVQHEFEGQPAHETDFLVAFLLVGCRFSCSRLKLKKPDQLCRNMSLHVT